MTYEFIEKRILSRVKNSFDKREGSIIFDSTAPIAFELAEAYIMAQVILKQTFATTADREFLVLRASEYNIYPESATCAEMKGKFSKAVPVGTRFNYENYNFTVADVIDDTAHTYKLVCETAGKQANSCIGDITPITQISGLETAKIIEIITPGEDEEDTETFRQRYINALKSKAYGGNGADYREKVLAIHGVGGVKVYRCWNGGGTVKCVILDSEYNKPTDELIKEVQTQIDPTQKGDGYGLAPIGHVVTVTGAKEKAINVTCTIITDEITPALTDKIKSKINEYLRERRAEWCKQTHTQFVTVRSAFLLVKLLEIQGIKDAIVTLDNKALKIDIANDEIPSLGKLTVLKG